MTTVMAPQSPFTTGRPDWSTGHVPRLSYRNPLPPGESLPERKMSPESSKEMSAPILSIREIHEATLRQTALRDASQYAPRSLVTSPPAQSEERKSSFLKGFFAREPTISAMNQFRGSVEEKHGAVSPTVFSGVSTQRMPGFVPKVNAKWSGVPEYVEKREKQEKKMVKTGHRTSLRPPNPRAPNSDQEELTTVTQRRGSNAASSAESWDSRSTGSRPLLHDGMSLRPVSIYSTSSHSSANHSQQTTPVLAQPYTHITASALSDSPTYGTVGTSSSSGGSQRWHSPQSIPTQSTALSDQSRPERSPRIPAPSVEGISEWASSSTATTPLECSPHTPAAFSEGENAPIPQFRGVPILALPVARKQSMRLPLAGRKSDKNLAEVPRRDSRAGLSLQTGNRVAPWESQSPVSETPVSPQSEMSPNTKGKARFWGRDKK